MAINVPPRYRDHWNRPWRKAAKYSPGFRLWLHRQGRLSPHFTYAEARSKDGTAIPRHLRTQARNHAFNLERLRHELGDRPVAITSWYRSPAHNRAVGGASQSKHMQAIATDHPREWVERMGRDLVLKHGNEIFRRGGMGTYPGGALHFDSRGTWARWSSWVPGR